MTTLLMLFLMLTKLSTTDQQRALAVHNEAREAVGVPPSHGPMNSQQMLKPTQKSWPEPNRFNTRRATTAKTCTGTLPPPHILVRTPAWVGSKNVTLIAMGAVGTATSQKLGITPKWFGRIRSRLESELRLHRMDRPTSSHATTLRATTRINCPI